jgi:aryl-alcohol dehydrogenase-like predicted oxidoreductase
MEGMNYRRLGRTDFELSEIGFGCMSLEQNNQANTRLIDQAIEAGINFFDTADLYDHGQNEIVVGKGIKEKRKQVILATKVGNQWLSDGSGWEWNPRKNYILAAAAQSLKRLQTDYIDLYQLHGGTLEDPMDEIMEAFEILQEQGKIRHYGISSIRPNVIRKFVTHSPISSLMMQYSLLDRRPEENCLDFLQAQHIGVLARGSLAKGLLVDKQPTDYLDHDKQKVALAAKVIQELSGINRSQAQTAIGYVLEHPAVCSVVVGIRNSNQLAEVVKPASKKQLTPDEYNRLRQTIAPHVYKDHR